MTKTKVEIHEEVEDRFTPKADVLAGLNNVIHRDTVTGLAMQYRALAHRVVDLTPVVKAQNDAVDTLFTSYENMVAAISKNQDKMVDVYNGVG